jgi:hypothetical protein
MFAMDISLLLIFMQGNGLLWVDVIPMSASESRGGSNPSFNIGNPEARVET